MTDRHRPDKRTTAAEAIAAFVRDGDVVCVAGFSHLTPYALGHEVIRQGRKDLTLVKQTPDLLGEQMLAAGCLAKIVFSWHGNPGPCNLALFRKRVEGGTLERKGPGGGFNGTLPWTRMPSRPGPVQRGDRHGMVEV